MRNVCLVVPKTDIVNLTGVQHVNHRYRYVCVCVCVWMQVSESVKVGSVGKCQSWLCVFMYVPMYMEEKTHNQRAHTPTRTFAAPPIPHAQSQSHTYTQTHTHTHTSSFIQATQERRCQKITGHDGNHFDLQTAARGCFLLGCFDLCLCVCVCVYVCVCIYMRRRGVMITRMMM